jgi:rhomboid protease GluP
MTALFKNSKEYMPTYILIAVNIAVYAFTSYLSGDFQTSQHIMAAFGQDNVAVLNGEVWRLFTSMFVHANIVHIFGNMFFLLIFGLRAEDMFDVKEYLFIYFLSGLTGGVLTLIVWPDAISVGASGAIFGILGATIIYVRRAIGQSIITALVYAFFLFIINIGPEVNFIAHLGGLLVGLLTGYLLAATRKRKTAYTYGYSYQARMCVPKLV